VRPTGLDDLADLDIVVVPEFDDFEFNFGRWPFVAVGNIGERRVLLIGQLSARTANGGRVVRSCAVNEVPFDEVRSHYTLTSKRWGLRRRIKVLSYEVGLRVRCWTNIGGRDREEFARHLVLARAGLAEIVYSKEAGSDTLQGASPSPRPSMATNRSILL